MPIHYIERLPQVCVVLKQTSKGSPGQERGEYLQVIVHTRGGKGGAGDGDSLSNTFKP